MGLSTAYARIIGSLLKESLADWVGLDTIEDDHTFVMKDASMMSIIRIDGLLRTPSIDQHAEMVERLRIALSSYMSLPGHAIEITFTRDPDAARRDLRVMVERTGRAARSLGIDVEDVLAEREAVLSRRMVSETCFMAIHTRVDALGAEELADERKRTESETKKMPYMIRAQSPKGMDALHSRHQAMVEALQRSFSLIGCLSEILDVVTAAQEIRASLYPAISSEKREWRPRLPSWHGQASASPRMVMMPETETEMAGKDFSNMFVPSLDRQIVSEEAHVLSPRMVRIGDRIVSAFDMTLAPETLPNFNDMVRDITAKSVDIPWRASIRIESGGMHAMALKAMYLGVFTFASPTHNRRIREAINGLREADGVLDTVVKFRMSFATWAPVSEEEVLRRNAQVVMGAVQRWGNSRADGVSGDPLATAVSTVTGIGCHSTAPIAAAPLGDALAMSPLARNACPWQFGGVMFRTDDGKPWPFQPGSSKQTTWITLVTGTPGSGKSVLMNAINFAAAITPSTAGGDKPLLPRIAMIDIGNSSSGLISLIKEGLPSDRRHEVVFRKLRMSRDDAINVFDTQLGMRRPTANERQFLINFLSLICSDGGKPPHSAMRGLITAAIDQAYLDFSDQNNPRRYLPADSPDVDKALSEIGFQPHEETVWWDVVDALMEGGRIYQAEIAQRHAVPTLSDLVTASQTEQVVSLYRSATDPETGQSIMTAFQRMISEVVRDFPIISSYTRFSIGSARIISLDLMDVTVGGAGAGAKKQTALMYMLARQVLARDFFLDATEFGSAAREGTLPRVYLEHHLRRVRENLQVPKLICMDEFHRTGKIESICEQLQQDAREGRKFNVDIKIASQLLEDFPAAILEIASGIILCNAGSEASIETLHNVHLLSDGERQILRDELTGPSPRGAPVWAFFRLREMGSVRQKLVLTLGPAEIWAFSTTAEDVALRTRLYEEIGPQLTRKVLARRFPGGSAKAEIETRLARLEDLGTSANDEARLDVIGQLVEDLKRQAFLLEDR